MLMKLLKYDLKATGRFWWITAVSMLTMSFLGGLAISSLIWYAAVNSNNMDMLGMMVIMFLYLAFLFCCMGIGVCFVAVEVLIFIRFFKHLFTDEGYLTFTLPVSRKQIFLSKVLSGVIWSCASYALMLVGFALIIFMIFVPFLCNNDARESLFGFFEYLISNLQIPVSQYIWFAIWIIVSVIGIVASLACSVCLTYFCITLGATVVRRGKIAVAIGVYYGMVSITYLLYQALATFGFYFLSGGAIEILMRASDLSFNVIVTLVISLIALAMATLAAFFYCLTQNILERKLNLA